MNPTKTYKRIVMSILNSPLKNFEEQFSLLF
jgi:hypothetical protein